MLKKLTSTFGNRRNHYLFYTPGLSGPIRMIRVHRPNTFMDGFVRLSTSNEYQCPASKFLSPFQSIMTIVQKFLSFWYFTKLFPRFERHNQSRPIKTHSESKLRSPLDSNLIIWIQNLISLLFSIESRDLFKKIYYFFLLKRDGWIKKWQKAKTVQVCDFGSGCTSLTLSGSYSVSTEQ